MDPYYRDAVFPVLLGLRSFNVKLLLEFVLMPKGQGSLNTALLLDLLKCILLLF